VLNNPNKRNVKRETDSLAISAYRLYTSFFIQFLKCVIDSYQLSFKEQVIFRLSNVVGPVMDAEQCVGDDRRDVYFIGKPR
jgi:hypothetical protein